MNNNKLIATVSIASLLLSAYSSITSLLIEKRDNNKHNGLLSVQLLNTTKSAIELSLQIGEQLTRLQLDANALQTIQVPLNP